MRVRLARTWRLYSSSVMIARGWRRTPATRRMVGLRHGSIDESTCPAPTIEARGLSEGRIEGGRPRRTWTRHRQRNQQRHTGCDLRGAEPVDEANQRPKFGRESCSPPRRPPPASRRRAHPAQLHSAIMITRRCRESERVEALGDVVPSSRRAFSSPPRSVRPATRLSASWHGLHHRALEAPRGVRDCDSKSWKGGVARQGRAMPPSALA